MNYFKYYSRWLFTDIVVEKIVPIHTMLIFVAQHHFNEKLAETYR